MGIFDAAAQVIGAGVSAFSQHSANEANKQMAQNQMDFQERMSDTAYQRQVADMKKAGINPILSAHMGGASSPGGAFAQMQSVAPNMGQLANSAVSADIARKQLHQQSGFVQAQTRLANSQAHLADTNSANSVANLIGKGSKAVGAIGAGLMGSTAIGKVGKWLSQGRIGSKNLFK